MITILSGTNRNNSNTYKVAKLVESELQNNKVETQFIDLNKLPPNLFIPENYGNAPKSFEPFQKMVLETNGIITVVPEYNGSYPGALKYFIDLLKFPESFNNMPAGFIGVAAGIFGSFRSVEQLQMVYQYRGAKLFNRYVLFPKVHEKLNPEGTEITDKFTRDLFQQFIRDFPIFSKALRN